VWEPEEDDKILEAACTSSTQAEFNRRMDELALSLSRGHRSSAKSATGRNSYLVMRRLWGLAVVYDGGSEYLPTPGRRTHREDRIPETYGERWVLKQASKGGKNKKVRDPEYVAGLLGRSVGWTKQALERHNPQRYSKGLGILDKLGLI